MCSLSFQVAIHSWCVYNLLYTLDVCCVHFNLLYTHTLLYNSGMCGVHINLLHTLEMYTIYFNLLSWKTLLNGLIHSKQNSFKHRQLIIDMNALTKLI